MARGARGFTERTKLAKATLLCPGNVQPKLRADLGFYDLQVPAVRAAPALLACRSDAGRFAYWHLLVWQRPAHPGADLQNALG